MAADSGRGGGQRVLANVLGGISLLLLLVSFALFVATLDVPWNGWGLRGGVFLQGIAQLAISWVLTRQRPGNPIGWILAASTVLAALDTTVVYLDLLLVEHGTHWVLPGAILDVAWVPTVVLFLLAFAVFPDGRLPDGWRRRALQVLAPVAVVAVSSAFFLEGLRLGTEAGGAGASTQAPPFLFLPMPLYGLLAVSTFVVRFRRSEGVERQQFRWVAWPLIPYVLTFLLLPLIANETALLLNGVLGTILSTLVVVSLGVAVLRYRLWDLDRIVSRTVAWALLTGTLAAIWTGLVIAPTIVLGNSEEPNEALVAAATLLAAAAFNPLRVRFQGLIDRRLNRDRYDARQAIEQLGGRLGDEVDLEAMSDRVLGTLATTIQPRHAAIWIPEREGVA